MHPQCTFTSGQITRFLDRFTVIGECWVYPVGKGNDYGTIGVGNHPMLAHRFSWELHYGPIPEGLFVLHNCPGGDNPACVNPDHLWLGTNADNMADMVAKGRHGTKQHAGYLPRAERHWTHVKPERIARGNRHSSKTKPDAIPQGEHRAQAKLKDADVAAIRMHFAQRRRDYTKVGQLYRELGLHYGVSESNIRLIVKHQTWKHLP